MDFVESMLVFDSINDVFCVMSLVIILRLGFLLNKFGLLADQVSFWLLIIKLYCSKSLLI